MKSTWPTKGAVLVTGAAGFAGSHLLELLADATMELVAWHRPGAQPPATPNVQWAPIDLLDRSAVSDAIAELRPTIIYHCAGAAHVGRAWEAMESTFAINVRGTHHVLEALGRAQLTARMLIPSSAMVYRPANEPLTEEDPLVPASPYGLSKLAQELLAFHAASAGLDIRIARAFNHMGPRQDPSFAASGFARRIAEIEAGRAEPEITVGNLAAERDLTDVRDTVRAYLTIVRHGAPTRAYNVCSGRTVTIRELLDRLLARARLPIRVRVDPTRLRPNDAPRLLGDPSRIREELGWAPAIPFEQTLDDLLEYWRQQAR